MWDKIINYGVVYVGSMVKFIFGPIAGSARNLSVVETAIFTALGMMTIVLMVSLLNDGFRQRMVWKLKRDKRLFTRHNRRLVRIWGKFGIHGIAFLTPVLFMPIGGALIAISFGASRRQMLKYMAVSAIFWGFAYSFAIQEFSWLVSKVF